ncbi:MAG: hypothetical protein IJD76_00290 [Bacilli bacterium]|nr:hypothetical protein [Bacilli bacterium]
MKANSKHTNSKTSYLLTRKELLTNYLKQIEKVYYLYMDKPTKLLESLQNCEDFKLCVINDDLSVDIFLNRIATKVIETNEFGNYLHITVKLDQIDSLLHIKTYINNEETRIFSLPYKQRVILKEEDFEVEQ